jgi:hypothetical protein
MFHIDISSDHASLRGALVMVMAATPLKATVLLLCVEFQTWRNAPRPWNYYWPAESKRANCPGLISMAGGVRS